jgi:hypothetical protein
MSAGFGPLSLVNTLPALRIGDLLKGFLLQTPANWLTPEPLERKDVFAKR